MNQYSIARRMALMFALAAALVFAVAGLALYKVQCMETHRHQMQEIRIRFDYIEGWIARRIDGVDKWGALEEKLKELTLADGSVMYRIESSDPRFRLGTALPNVVKVSLEPDGLKRVVTADHVYLTLTKAVPPNGERPAVQLTLAVDPSPFETTNRTFGIALLLSFIFGTTAVGGLGWWITRHSLMSVDDLSQDARTLGPQNLAGRLPDSALPRELAGLVLSFNGALDRVEHAYVQLSSFNADVAHELRTPLGNLIGQTQVTLSRDRSASELEETLQSNLEELERLRVIVNDMLFLAQADKGVPAINRIRTSIADEVRKSAEFLDVLTEEAGVSILIEGDAQALIECSLFGRAITNLLYNALQHGAKNQPICIHFAQTDQYVSISVRNKGNCIEASHLDRLFDRFYRVDPARLHSSENHGLGLAIVKAIAMMHGGSVFASSDAGVTTIGFTVAND